MGVGMSEASELHSRLLPQQSRLFFSRDNEVKNERNGITGDLGTSTNAFISTDAFIRLTADACPCINYYRSVHIENLQVVDIF